MLINRYIHLMMEFLFMGKRGPKPSFVDVPCPNGSCKDYGKIGNDNVIGNGKYSTDNGIVHKFHCNTCSKSFTSRANTVLHDLRTDEKTFFLALKMILKGVNLRSTAEILEVKVETVRRWLRISAEHCEEVNKSFNERVRC
jgi:transposase-like protein